MVGEVIYPAQSVGREAVPPSADPTSATRDDPPATCPSLSDDITAAGAQIADIIADRPFAVSVISAVDIPDREPSAVACDALADNQTCGLVAPTLALRQDGFSEPPSKGLQHRRRRIGFCAGILDSGTGKVGCQGRFHRAGVKEQRCQQRRIVGGRSGRWRHRSAAGKRDGCGCTGQTSRLATDNALSWMNSRRGSTTSPINRVKISSATSA